MTSESTETMITPEGHKFTGALRSVMGVAGLVRDGPGVMHFTNSDIYTGNWVLNKRSGDGEQRYADGSRYDGEWLNDHRHGCGELREANGDVYEGHFRDNKKHGVGTYTFSTGERYTGTFADDMRHGRGIIDFPNGSWFEGTLLNNEISGTGTMRFASGDEYVGSFQHNKMHGKGVYTFVNGDVHEGEYRDGVRVNGTIRRSDGTVYDAQFTPTGEVEHLTEALTGTSISFVGKSADQDWKDGEGEIKQADDVYSGAIRGGKRNGFGTVNYANGDLYEGEWLDDCRHGTGKLQLHKVTQLGPNLFGWRYTGGFVEDQFGGHGTLLLDVEGNKYAGNWKDGVRSGCGREEVGGDVYEGQFDQDTRHGKGTLTTREGQIVECQFVRGVSNDPNGAIHYPDGALYRGAVKGCARHGEGRMQFANGDIYDGEYRNDTRHGVGMLACANGDMYQGMWSDDAMHGGGTFTHADGTVYEGKMSNGVKHGVGVLKTDACAFKVVFKHNVLEKKEIL